jgi:LuxR family maltose regulon positive regulatory protein
MAEDTTTIPLIRTKLHRPPLVGDHVHRPHLLERLDQRQQRPLTLVSAPAGYGKSTLVSCWLEASNLPSAWLSLDETDSDLRLFLSYLLAAVQSIIPGVGMETQTLLKASNLPPLAVLARTLINDLDQIEKGFILVLDDYHVIREQTVHDLLSELLVHPPGCMHLVVATRRDPSLPLTELRARGQVTEVRVQELRFSAKETAAFLQQAMGMAVDAKTAAVLEEKTEGWVAGLRLAALSLRERADLDRILESLPDENRYVMDYIISEVLSKQPPDMENYLLSTAILNRFCAPLCKAVCSVGNKQETGSIGGEEFISRLDQSNLFVVPLDDQGRWYRYHHLFQQLLQSQMEKRFSPDAIAELHKRAGGWFMQNSLLDEALQHFLSAEDIPAAKQLVANNRHYLTDKEQWHRLERWIGLLPKETIDRDPELLIAKAWLCENRLRIPEMVDLTKRAEAIVAGKGTETSPENGLYGELAALKAARFYLEGNGKCALSCAKQALETIPMTQASERAFALLVLAFACQMTGALNDAHTIVYNALEQADAYSYTYHARLMFGLCFIDWMEAEMNGLQQTATQVLNFGQKHGLMESTSFAHYFLGIAHYCLNDAQRAENHLASATKQGLVSNINTFVHSSFALALTYQAQGRQGEALNSAEAVVNYGMQTGNSSVLKTSRAFQAELALRQGRIAEAARWAQHYEPEPLTPALRFYLPQLTWTKVLIGQGLESAWSKAADLLDQMKDFYSSTHSTSCLIAVLTQQALLHDARGDEAKALSTLERAIILAEPSGFIRSFLDLGPKMAELLNRLAKQNIAMKYAGELLAAFRSERLGPGRTTLDDQRVAHLYSSHPYLDGSLTNREIEILALLAQRLSNREIAENLFISSLTVKKHLSNINQKLSVSSRRQAVEKAKALGILPRTNQRN